MLHTFFQLPLSEYAAHQGSRTQRALHALVFDPENGLIAGILELASGGQELLLQAEELRSWLGALAIDTRRIVLRSDLAAEDPLKIEIVP